MPRAWLARWLLIGLAARVFVPSGFMVGPIAEAWPVIPCPGEQHGPLLAGHAADPAEHDDVCDSDYCYQGLYFALLAETNAVDATPTVLPEAEPFVAAEIPAASTPHADSPQPRGPPSSVSNVA